MATTRLFMNYYHLWALYKIKEGRPYAFPYIFSLFPCCNFPEKKPVYTRPIFTCGFNSETFKKLRTFEWDRWLNGREFVWKWAIKPHFEFYWLPLISLCSPTHESMNRVHMAKKCVVSKIHVFIFGEKRNFDWKLVAQK